MSENNNKKGGDTVKNNSPRGLEIASALSVEFRMSPNWLRFFDMLAQTKRNTEKKKK